MKIVHKHGMNMDGTPTVIRLPEQAVVRHVEYVVAEHRVLLWIEVPAEIHIGGGLTDRSFQLFFTGKGIPAKATYVGSAVDQYQPEVYHVYETTGVTG